MKCVTPNQPRPADLANVFGGRRSVVRIAGMLLVTAGAIATANAEPAVVGPPSKPLGGEPRRTLAFPGAAGFGAHAVGGRGGQVICVTNLNDRGPGSLRAACNTTGPRTVVFLVGGLIDLESPIDVRRPYLTLACQTAPGDGICLRNFGVRIRDTHDVIIRYLRIRPGDTSGEEDALLIYRSRDIIIDHCSLSWSVDETLDVSDDWHEPIEGPKTDNVTIQWCIISESLNRSVHAKGAHGYAALISAIRDGEVTVHHNLFAHHLTRIPRPGGRRGTPGLRLEFRNNAIYDWGAPYAGYSADSETASATRLTYVGNYLRPGPSTPAKGRRVAFHSAPPTHIFAAGNALFGDDAATRDNWLMFKGKFTQLDQPHTAPQTTLEPATAAYERILSQAGATRPARDQVDQRVVTQVLAGSGRLIDSPNDVGGWPSYRNGKPSLDDDSDGMPDAWEQLHGLDPEDDSDGPLDKDADGYTNLEEYLNDGSFGEPQ